MEARLPKREATISSGIVQTNFSDEILTNQLGQIENTVALKCYFSGDLLELDEKCNSMMEKTSKKKDNGNVLYKCRVCGKEDQKGHMNTHIEFNHLEGVLIPCNFCEKKFRSRNAMKKHNHRYHN